MTRTPALVAATLLLFSANAAALQMIEKAGLYIYFPAQEAELVARFSQPLPEMLAFLSDKGLEVKPPLHIVLDDRRDVPEVKDHVIPHKEILIPIRAPGVLEDGYTEPDPWAYFMFKGLCLQGIYGIRSGIPGLLHKGFGEIISPNRVLPPWVDDGICTLLYSQFRGRPLEDPLSDSIFALSPLPELDIISHHPQIWPGYHAHRIFGRPFIQWLHDRYGWEKILEFLKSHGRGIIPLEIDLKAIGVFGRSGAALWSDFQMQHPRRRESAPAYLIGGYWAEPLAYWNNAGVFPGRLGVSRRGRYGYVDDAGTLWISQYDGESIIHRYGDELETTVELYSLWDPGPGRVAVARRGHKSWLVVFPEDGEGGLRLARKALVDQVEEIPAPAGVLQLSGPVRNQRGHIAVAANINGNWDIWVYDGRWRRLTDSPSVELDPWWEGETLVWASNASGRFQIHRADNTPITSALHGALLPRGGRFLALTANGWQMLRYDAAQAQLAPLQYIADAGEVELPLAPPIEPQLYDPFKSLWPNYIRPDLFAGIDDFQIGAKTDSRDVSGDYRFDAGFRYSFDDDFVALQTLIQRRSIGTRYARYPFGFDNALGASVTEHRNDVALFWRPLWEGKEENTELLRARTGSDLLVDAVDLSINWRHFEPQDGAGPSDEEAWIALAAGKSFGNLQTWGNLELFTENRQSLFGGAAFSFGDQIVTSLKLIGGKSWGETDFGHTTFRVGGDVIEGGFTNRPTRLFPIRGFDSGVLTATTAAAASAEVFWPLANLQFGYKALPFFLHRLRLGTFVDAGFASDDLSSDDLLVGAGFELLTSLEVGWSGFSTFRIGVSWPLEQPDTVDQDGPVIVFQLGAPL